MVSFPPGPDVIAFRRLKPIPPAAFRSGGLQAGTLSSTIASTTIPIRINAEVVETLCNILGWRVLDGVNSGRAEEEGREVALGPGSRGGLRPVTPGRTICIR